MATKWTTETGYAVTETARRAGTKLEARGATHVNRDWLAQQLFVCSPKSQTWKRIMPTNKEATAQLLYGLVSRGMEWRAISR